jgi:hypothetical protein
MGANQNKPENKRWQTLLQTNIDQGKTKKEESQTPPAVCGSRGIDRGDFVG